MTDDVLFPNQPVDYYRQNANGTTDCFPGVVVYASRRRVLIHYYDDTGSRFRWVDPASLDPQLEPAL